MVSKFLFIWILLVLFIISRIIIDNENDINNTEQLEFDKIKLNAKTGDLIYFRWNYVNTLFRIFSYFSHVGMIIKIKGILYILETHPDEKNKNKNKNKINSGVHLYLLESRIKKSIGTYFYTKLNVSSKKRKDIQIHIKLNLKKYKKDIKFDNNFKFVFVQNYIYNLLNIKLHKRKEMFCSEFIGNILKKTNIYYHKNLTSLHPGSFLYLMKKNNLNLYKPLRQIIF